MYFYKIDETEEKGRGSGVSVYPPSSHLAPVTLIPASLTDRILPPMVILNMSWILLSCLHVQGEISLSLAMGFL
jgi:hypothetical protein